MRERRRSEPGLVGSRSREGLSTKIHALVDAEGEPVRLDITSGQASDVQGADILLNDLAAGSVLLGDKGYHSDCLREKIEAQDAAPNIPDKSNRTEKLCFRKVLYKQCNRVERFLNKIKRFRWMATRYDILGTIRIRLRSIESTHQLPGRALIDVSKFVQIVIFNRINLAYPLDAHTH
jgi:transposase